MDGQREQLWLEPAGDGVYSAACIPFRTYGPALGDRVCLSENDEVSEAVERSSHRVLRIMLLTPTPDPGRLVETTDRIRAEISAAGLLSERSGDRHVAVDIPADRDPSDPYAAVKREAAADRAFWEWADAMPFSTGS
ncbi:DUF4265 domain-containing protein [Streptomyces antibioticus]|uniref:DUF4265 domain-containing protein n=1 Tax=Streptomyces antibioticus TaxID=1890 RepID=UPI00369CE40B